MSKRIKPGMGHAILTGPVKAVFCFASMNRRQAMTMTPSETIGLEFDTGDAEVLADMFETFARLIRETPKAMQAAVDAGQVPEHALTDDAPEPRKPDPMAN